jgi:HEAT repeat protein
MKNPRAIDVLINALDEDLELDRSDCALTISSIRALGNRKVLQARGKIEKFLAHRERVVQKEAQRSLKKLDRAKAKAREKGLSGTTLNGSTT